MAIITKFNSNRTWFKTRRTCHFVYLIGIEPNKQLTCIECNRTQHNQIKVQRSILIVEFAMQWFQNVTNQKATLHCVANQFDTLHTVVMRFATIQNCTKIIATFYTQKFDVAFLFFR